MLKLKKLVYLLLLSISAINAKGNFTSNELLQAISNDYKQVYNMNPVSGKNLFNENNIFNNPLNKDSLAKWNQTILNLKEFSKDKGHNNSIINKAMDSLVDLAYNIENSVKVAKNSSAINKITNKQIGNLADILENLKADLEKAQKNNIALNKESFYLYSNDRKAVKNLQNTLLTDLDKITNKVIDDALRYQSKETAKGGSDLSRAVVAPQGSPISTEEAILIEESPAQAEEKKSNNIPTPPPAPPVKRVSTKDILRRSLSKTNEPTVQAENIPAPPPPPSSTKSIPKPKSVTKESSSGETAFKKIEPKRLASEELMQAMKKSNESRRAQISGESDNEVDQWD